MSEHTQNIDSNDDQMPLIANSSNENKASPAFAEKADGWSGLFNNTLTAVFFMAITAIKSNIFSYKTVMALMLAAEASGWASKLSLAIYAKEDESTEAWLSLAKSTLYLLGVTTVVVAGAMLEVATIALLGPVIFTALCFTGIAYHLGGMFYFGYQYLNSPRGEEGSKLRKTSDEHWKKFLGHTEGFALTFVVTAGIAFGLLTFPISAPVVLTIAGAIVGAHTVWNSGVLQWAAKKTGVDIAIEKLRNALGAGIETVTNTLKKWVGINMAKKHVALQDSSGNTSGICEALSAVALSGAMLPPVTPQAAASALNEEKSSKRNSVFSISKALGVTHWANRKPATVVQQHSAPVVSNNSNESLLRV